MVKNIAEQEEIPAHFLAKNPANSSLAKGCCAPSKRSRRAAFALRVEPSEIRLLDIVEALGRSGAVPSNAPAACPSARTKCPGSMHDSWIALRSRIMDYLGNNTIADLAKALEVKRKNLSKHRKTKRAVVARRA